MHPYINIATKAVRMAGKVLIEATLHLNVTATNKKLSFSAELYQELLFKPLSNAVVNIITKAYPTHRIQINDFTSVKDPTPTWVVDLLSGEINFLYGIPLFAVSIAIVTQDQVEHAVIYNPITDELFIASKGSGSRLNHQRIRSSVNNKLNDALLSINSEFWSKEDFKLTQKSSLLPKFSNQMINRELGSVALGLAYVAAGRLDGYCDVALPFYKIAAGALLVKEAGGYIGDLNGKLELTTNSNIIAGNPKLYSALIELLR